jgi:hypothetical protein
VSESPEQKAERAERVLRYAERQMAWDRLIAAIRVDFLATQHERERRERENAA